MTVPQSQIRRDIFGDFRLYNTEDMRKRFRYSSSKRWRLPSEVDPSGHGDSLPFGYAGPEAPIYESSDDELLDSDQEDQPTDDDDSGLLFQ